MESGVLAARYLVGDIRLWQVSDYFDNNWLVSWGSGWLSDALLRGEGDGLQSVSTVAN